MNIERIICSPYLRATQTIMPLARRLNLTVENDVRLVERVLCPTPLPDWKDRLRDSFSNLDLTLEGGESGRAAMQRAVAVITDVQSHRAQNTLLVTHGNLMTLLLKHFDETIGFDEWSALTNPDAFRVLLNKPVSIERLWAS